MRATIETKMADWGEFSSHVARWSEFSHSLILFKSVSNVTDDEDFEPQEFSVNKSDKWEGEDEDENDVKARENVLSS